ncbi:N-acetylmuramoyl-L-alanine amidase [Jeotgalibaca dankookensis]|uniref:N-acetylmuramoyl-L-alanine amidase n=1 Tax=Jeotgalibaca dankookensis TaxID=708126 RepID=UPI0007848C08|nr:N-acetylmuramoyl-L-alanine amidase [Jeotgalibaca dankookensis]
MQWKILVTFMSALVLGSNVSLPVMDTHMSNEEEIKSELVEEVETLSNTYYQLKYDGSKQTVSLTEDLELLLFSWKDEKEDTILAEVSGEQIEIPVNKERKIYKLVDDAEIDLAAENSKTFIFSTVVSEQKVETFIPVEVNENLSSKEQIAIIDEFGTILEWVETFQYLDATGTIISEEEYQKLNTVGEEEPDLEIEESQEESSEIIEEGQNEISSEEEPIADVESSEEEEKASNSEVTTFSMSKVAVTKPTLTYQTHVESHGWMPAVKNGEMAGTSGQKKRLEAIKLNIAGIKGLEISYATHIQSKGWTKYVSNNQISGTVGSGKRLEAIKIKLNGVQASKYDIYYRVHVEKFGWLDWAKNDEPAGTAGLGRRVEAIEVKLVYKGTNKPTDTSNYFVEQPIVTYRSDIKGQGWQPYVSNGVLSGSVGKKKAIQAIEVSIPSQSGLQVSQSIYAKKGGWVDGLSSNGQQIEAIKLNLTGKNAQLFDIYYRVHAQKIGWLGWAKNGESAGTEGYDYRLEAYEVKVVPKWQYVNRGDESFKYKDKSSVTYSSHVQSLGWLADVTDGQVSGTEGRSLRMEGLKINLNHDKYSGDISYETHVQSYGWLNPVSNGSLSGTTGRSKRLEAVKINLTGEIADYYDVYYRVHAESYGWLGWAKNGEPAGTEGVAKRLESLQVQLVEKGLPAPSGNKKEAFIKPVPVTKRVVFLDVGHGGSDSGAQYYGIKEKDLNLRMGKKMQKDLEKAGYTVIMSRTDDTYMDIRSERSEMANNSGAEIFISLHNNAMPGNSYVNGIETYYYEYDPNYQPVINQAMHNNPDRLLKSAALAKAVHSNLINHTGATDRGVRRETFAVLRETALPSILLEFGYMSNYDEVQRLLTDKYQHTLSKALLEGVNAYFKTY